LTLELTLELTSDEVRRLSDWNITGILLKGKNNFTMFLDTSVGGRLVAVRGMAVCYSVSMVQPAMAMAV
jgi:hypothetical protein